MLKVCEIENSMLEITQMCTKNQIILSEINDSLVTSKITVNLLKCMFGHMSYIFFLIKRNSNNF